MHLRAPRREILWAWRPRGSSVRVGFRTTATLPLRRVRVGSLPHVLPGGRAVCWLFCLFCFISQQNKQWHTTSRTKNTSSRTQAWESCLNLGIRKGNREHQPQALGVGCSADAPRPDSAPQIPKQSDKLSKLNKCLRFV